LTYPSIELAYELWPLKASNTVDYLLTNHGTNVGAGILAPRSY
jgi:hypothetical protein